MQPLLYPAKHVLRTNGNEGAIKMKARKYT
jgi:hypothetical protein